MVRKARPPRLAQTRNHTCLHPFPPKQCVRNPPLIIPRFAYLNGYQAHAYIVAMPGETGQSRKHGYKKGYLGKFADGHEHLRGDTNRDHRCTAVSAPRTRTQPPQLACGCRRASLRNSRTSLAELVPVSVEVDSREHSWAVALAGQPSLGPVTLRRDG